MREIYDFQTDSHHLPQMTEEEALEVTKIYSVAGLLEGQGKLVKSRPFRSPHHNASTNSLIGGG